MTASVNAPSNVTDIAIWAVPKAKLILPADKAGTREWYETRRKGIGASDFAPIKNESPWANATPYGVWLDKLEDRQLEETPAMHWGTVLEDAIARDWATARGLSVRNVGTYQSRSHEHCLANPDRLVSDGGGLEVKTANAFTKAWADGKTPAQYLLQVLFCMAVTGKRHWWLVCLIGGQKMEVRRVQVAGQPIVFPNTVEVTEQELADALDYAEDWWVKHVENFEVPELGKPVELEEIEEDSYADAPLPEAVLDDRARWDELDQLMKDADEEIEAIRERLKFELAGKKRLRANGRVVAVMVERKGSRKFDRAGLKRDLPEIEAKYTKEPGEPTRFVARVGGNDE